MGTTSVAVIEFDFDNRRSRDIPIEQARDACAAGRSCWIDMDLSDPEYAESVLAEFGINRPAIEATLSPPFAGRYVAYDSCVHVTVAAPERGPKGVCFSYVDFIIGERFVFSLRRTEVDFLRAARQNYAPFFARFAHSLGFLLFEFWDHLIESYRKVFKELEEEVELLQSSIFGKVDDHIFSRVAELSHDLLELRKNALADREALHQMALHKSSFVGDKTQPYLSNLVGTLERLGTDLTVEREILSETLNLHLGMVGHRTNRIINRLTVISVIFLPLTFLVGVYGMNFAHQPEFQWRYGYYFFWGLAVSIVAGILVFMKSRRWW